MHINIHKLEYTVRVLSHLEYIIMCLFNKCHLNLVVISAHND